MTVEAGAIINWKDAKAVQEIEKRRLQGAASFKMRCESHKDFDHHPRQVMEYEMDRLMDNVQSRSR